MNKFKNWLIKKLQGRSSLQLLVTFPPIAQDRLEEIEQVLEIDRSEAIQQALWLYSHALKANSITLEYDGFEEVIRFLRSK